jgi:hypothetical protein
MVDLIRTSKQCRYCASEIPIRAAVCATCKYHQSAWRNNLLFVGGLAGFITLIATAIAFLFSQTTQAYKNFFRREDVRVLSLEAGPPPALRTALVNGGDDPVFATAIVVYVRTGSFNLPVNRLINTNEIVTVDAVDSVAGLKDLRDNNVKFHFLANKSGFPSEKIIQNTVFKVTTPQDVLSCLFPVVLDENNATITSVNQYYEQNYGTKLIILRSHAAIFYHSTRSSGQRTFPISIAFVSSDRGGCDGIAVD